MELPDERKDIIKKVSDISELLMKQSRDDKKNTAFQADFKIFNISGVEVNNLIIFCDGAEGKFTIVCSIKNLIEHMSVCKVTDTDIKKCMNTVLDAINSIIRCEICYNAYDKKSVTIAEGKCFACSLQMALNIDEKKLDNCSICSDPIHKKHKIRCGHSFHKKCILDMIGNNPTVKHKCPNCRVFLNPEDEQLSEILSQGENRIPLRSEIIGGGIPGLNSMV